MGHSTGLVRYHVHVPLRLIYTYSEREFIYIFVSQNLGKAEGKKFPYGIT